MNHHAPWYIRWPVLALGWCVVGLGWCVVWCYRAKLFWRIWRRHTKAMVQLHEAMREIEQAKQRKDKEVGTPMWCYVIHGVAIVAFWCCVWLSFYLGRWEIVASAAVLFYMLLFFLVRYKGYSPS